MLLQLQIIATQLCVDNYKSVSILTEMKISGPLWNKNPIMFLNNVVESIFALKNFTAHPTKTNSACSGDKDAGLAVNFDVVKLSIPSKKDKRVCTHNMLFSHVKEESKINVTATLTKEVLGAAMKTDGNLDGAYGN